jgi:hypothetical protein
MQQIDMSRTVALGMKRTLHDKRSDMAPANQPGFAAAPLKPKLQFCAPTIRIQGTLLSPAIAVQRASGLPTPPTFFDNA